MDFQLKFDKEFIKIDDHPTKDSSLTNERVVDVHEKKTLDFVKEEINLQCDSIGSGFNTFNILENGMEPHSDDNPFKVENLQGISLYVPVQQHTDPYARILLEPPARILHPPESVDVPTVQCFYNRCNFKTNKKELMLQHEVRNPFKCSSCGFESLTEQIMRDHLEAFHSDLDCEMIALYEKHTEPQLQAKAPFLKRDAKSTRLVHRQGDAPTPVVTVLVSDLDALELKFGHYGKPYLAHYVCPKCAFISKSREEMMEHLFKDLEYKPVLCKICKTKFTQRTEGMTHLFQQHDVFWDQINKFLEMKCNKELENWVEQVLFRQQIMMILAASATEGSSDPPSKRRRSSCEASGEIETPQLKSNPSISADDKDGQRICEKGKQDKCPSRHRFSCGYCGVPRKYKHSIVLHNKKFHPGCIPKVSFGGKIMKEASEVFNCMYCHCTALNLTNLKHHWNFAHKNSGLRFLFLSITCYTDMEFKCYWCNKRIDVKTLEEHCKYDHSVELSLFTF